MSFSSGCGIIPPPNNLVIVIFLETQRASMGWVHDRTSLTDAVIIFSLAIINTSQYIVTLFDFVRGPPTRESSSVQSLLASILSFQSAGRPISNGASSSSTISSSTGLGKELGFRARDSLRTTYTRSPLHLHSGFQYGSLASWMRIFEVKLLFSGVLASPNCPTVQKVVFHLKPVLVSDALKRFSRSSSDLFPPFLPPFSLLNEVYPLFFLV